jgi:hypothetical protein
VVVLPEVLNFMKLVSKMEKEYKDLAYVNRLKWDVPEVVRKKSFVYQCLRRLYIIILHINTLLKLQQTESPQLF